MKKFGSILAFSLCVLLAASCSRDGEFDPVKGYSHVFIYCGLGYNNLSGYLEDDLEEMEEGLLPELNRDLAVVATTLPTPWISRPRHLRYLCVCTATKGRYAPIP